LAAGAIVGIVLASLLAFALLGFGYWLRRTRRDRDDSGDGGDPYWERRFQELESVQSKAKLESTVQSPSDAEGTWRKHVCFSLPFSFLPDKVVDAESRITSSNYQSSRFQTLPNLFFLRQTFPSAQSVWSYQRNLPGKNSREG
jgi:hypothetical protein